MKKSVVLIAVCCAALVAVTAGSAQTRKPGVAVPAISWGVADDMPKYAADGGEWFYQQLKRANLTENRWTLAFNPASPTTIAELPFLVRAAPLAQQAGVHVVLALYSGTPAPDAKDHDPAAFCNWAGLVATTVKQWGISDFIVGNEPNTLLYWAPQKDASGKDVAAAPYEALLAACYDSIKAANPAATVIGMGLSPRASTPKSNDPLKFLRDVGAVYRASGRTKPLMDQLALHPYPNPYVKGSPPNKGYGPPNQFGIPQLGRVKQAVWDAFHGTGQPTTQNGLTFRLDEVGWQTNTNQYPQYFGAENWKQVISEQTQADYIKTMVTKYFACDPTVTSVELFLLVDEKYRNGHDETGANVGGGWQSGLMTAGGAGISAPKVAFTQDAPLFAQGRAACSAKLLSWSPAKVKRH